MLRFAFSNCSFDAKCFIFWICFASFIITNILHSFFETYLATADHNKMHFERTNEVADCCLNITNHYVMLMSRLTDLSVYIHMSFDFPFVRLFGVR
jgi:hypothetical protein